MPFEVSPLCANKWVEIDMSCDRLLCFWAIFGLFLACSCCYCCCYSYCFCYLPLARFVSGSPSLFASTPRLVLFATICCVCAPHWSIYVLMLSMGCLMLLDALGILVHSSSDLSLIFWMPMPMSRNYRPYGLYRPLFPGQLRQMHSNETRNHTESINWQWSPKSFGFSRPLPQADDVLSRKTRQTRLLWLASQKFDPSKFSKQRSEERNSDFTSPSVLHLFLENSWSDNLSCQTCINFCRTFTFCRQVKISGLHHVVHEICAHPANTNIINSKIEVLCNHLSHTALMGFHSTHKSRQIVAMHRIPHGDLLSQLPITFEVHVDLASLV